MFFEPTQEKNKILGIRLNEASLDEFNKFCQERNVSKSEVARTAITQYIILNYNEDINPKLIFSKSQFRYIMECLNSREIDQLVEISVQNGKYDMKSIESIIQKTTYKTLGKTEVAFQIKTLHRFIFSDEGQAWFEEFTHNWDKTKLIIEGKHRLGHNFSEYIQKLITKYVQFHNYDLDYTELRTVFHQGNTQFFLKCAFVPKTT